MKVALLGATEFVGSALLNEAPSRGHSVTAIAGDAGTLAADVPVLQLSLNLIQGPEFHFALGQKLKYLRDQGILIVGSGNIVHNLRRINFADDARPLDWALEVDAWVKQRVADGDYKAIVHDARDTEAGKLSIPTPDHWYPLLYALGAADNGEPLRFEYEGIENASISMRCLSLGA